MSPTLAVCRYGSALAFRTAAMGVLVAVLLVHPAPCQTLYYQTDDPEIELYFYPTTESNGTGSIRNRAATFGAFSEIDSMGQPVFFQGSGFDPSRRGSFIVVSDTSVSIPVGLAPQRYQIDSVRVTVTMDGGIGPIIYDNTAEDAWQLTVNGGDDPGHPVEMWGIGMAGDYTTFGFHGETEPHYFNEGDRRWPVASGAFSGPYQLYSIDAQGNDVENSVFGGYSTTAPDNVTEMFNASPFAIGRVHDGQGIELTPGSVVPRLSTFEFAPDLTDEGILAYLQSSLSEGHLGFFFSSLHQPAGHTGLVPYPDWLLDNVPGGPNPNGAGPTMQLQVTILDPFLPGDFDGDQQLTCADIDQLTAAAVQGSSNLIYDVNGDGQINTADAHFWVTDLKQTLLGDANLDFVVDGSDFGTWNSHKFTQNSAWCGGDFNVDGVVDGSDFGVWNSHKFQSADAATVPEPHGATLLVGIALFLGRRIRRRSSRER